MTRAETEAKIADLRQAAARLNQSAQYADSRDAYNADREAADRLIREANQLAASLPEGDAA